MASNDKSGPDDEAAEGSWSPRRPKGGTSRTSADVPAAVPPVEVAPAGALPPVAPMPPAPESTSTKTASDKAGKGDGGTPDPDVLVGEIEKTREELAETLDAIADKVSPKRVKARTKQAAKDGAAEAVESVKTTASETADKVKETASHAADAAKEAASHAADAAKEGVAAVKEKASGDSDPVRSPLTPATSVELDAAAPLDGAAVPVEPAPTPGALADASFVAVEPVGSEAPSYGSTLPPASPSRTPMLAGAGAALLVLLVVLKRRKR